MQPGRPYNTEISESLLIAAEEIMLAEGYSSLTVDRLVKKIGTTRPAFYRRYSGIAYIAFEVIRRKFNSASIPDLGSLNQDLLQLQLDEVAMFSDPLIYKNLPGLLETVRTDQEAAALYRDSFILPRRSFVTTVFERAYARGEIPQVPADLDFVCDLLLGPIFARTLLPGIGGIDADLAKKTKDLALIYTAGTSVSKPN